MTLKPMFSKIKTQVFVGVFAVSALITAAVAAGAYFMLEGIYKRNLSRTLADISAMVVNAVGGGSEEDIAEAGKVCGAFPERPICAPR